MMQLLTNKLRLENDSSVSWTQKLSNTVYRAVQHFIIIVIVNYYKDITKI